MCNLYSLKSGQKHIADTARAVRDLAGNMPPLPAIFPNRIAPVVRVAEDGVRELIMMRWGFPPPSIPGSKPRNPYLTNVRNTDSKYWLTYLKKPEARCLVPVTSFAEPDNNQGPRSIWTWFAQNEERPLMFFAGIWREWEGDRGTKAAPDVRNHLVFSFLTTDASPDVISIHPDATPVMLLDAGAREEWMNAPWEIARELQKPPPAGALMRIKNGIAMSNSIDDFLDLHQSDELMRLVGKSAIVQCIVEAERDSILMLNSSDEQFDTQKIEHTWLLKLVRMLGAHTPPDKFFDNVAFISFNYDRTLEHFLHHAIRNLYALDEQQARALLGKAQIYHPYGSIAPLSAQQESLSFGGFRGLSVASPNFARNIRTYTEEITEKKNELTQMRGAVGKSEQIVILGFGFHTQNIELMSGDFALKPVYATAYGASSPNRDIFKGRIGTMFAPSERKKGWQERLNISDNKAGDFMDEFRLPLLS